MAPDPLLPLSELEAFQELRSRAQGKVGHLSPDLVANHVLSVTRGGDWPVQKSALDALLRRFGFARRDGLVVTKRPAGSLGLGLYETGHKRESRPYRTFLASVMPPSGSCDCPDFLKGGLGLCKHLLVVLDELALKEAKWGRAAEAGTTLAASGPRLVWDPVRPLTGAADWLERLGFIPGDCPGPAKTRWDAKVRGWFAGTGASPRPLCGGAPGKPHERLELVGDLLQWIRRRVGRSTVPDDPALRPLLVSEVARLRLLLDGIDLAKELSTTAQTLKKPLYPYQMEGVARFLQSGRLLLADDMGLGKTIQAIAACHTLWHTGKVRRGLLIMPAALKAQWEREWRMFSDIPISIVDGSPSQRAELYRSCKKGFLAANYEQTLRDLAHMHAWAPDLVLLDEAQRIKNWATRTAAYVKRLQPKYRLVLTGTPMENRLEELASIMDWVDENALEPKWRLGPWHATLCDGRQEVAGARNLDTLRIRLAPAMLRRIRREVLDQLPARTDTRVPTALTSAQQDEHDALVPRIAGLLAAGRKRPLTQAEFLRLMQLLTTQRIICNGLAQLRFEDYWPALSTASGPRHQVLESLDSPKLLELRELLGHLVLESRQKVVVFSQWRRMLQLANWATADQLASTGLRSAFFSGDESQKRRTQNLIEFHDDPALAVLFATDAGGVGLNLQRAASTVVNLELPWNPAVLEQRIGRVYRLGQKQPVQVFNLISEQGIESRIADVVSNKQALFTGLFDGSSAEIRFSGSNRFLDGVERLVEPVPEHELPPLEELEEDDNDALPEPAPSTAAAPSAAPVTNADVPSLLASIRVERTSEGGMRLEAPPQAAETLAAMFQAMATLLGKVSGG